MRIIYLFVHCIAALSHLQMLLTVEWKCGTITWTGQKASNKSKSN